MLVESILFPVVHLQRVLIERITDHLPELVFPLWVGDAPFTPIHEVIENVASRHEGIHPITDGLPLNIIDKGRRTEQFEESDPLSEV